MNFDKSEIFFKKAKNLKTAKNKKNEEFPKFEQIDEKAKNAEGKILLDWDGRKTLKNGLEDP